MATDPSPIAVQFPLRGEWVAYHTPADRVPSHGINLWGQRYAYDFLRVEPGPAMKGWKFFSGPRWPYWLGGVPARKCPGWDQPIHAPFDGTVVEAHNGVAERPRVHAVLDLLRVLKNALTFSHSPQSTNAELAPMLGNHLILRRAGRGQEVYALLAHLRPGSLRVRSGEAIAAGQELARVGHTGNSTAPHLHVQLMTQPRLTATEGLPCCFARYEALRDSQWRAVTDGMPARGERVRFV